MPEQKQSAWYAVLTRSRQEKIAANMLVYLSVETFLPLLNQQRQWSDRRQMVTLPLFPGYLFVRATQSSAILLRVLQVPGIVDFVRNREGPTPIPDIEIESVRTVLSREVSCSPHPFLNTGDRVRVVHGALTGVEGLLLRDRTASKLIVSIQMIQGSVAVNVDAASVVPVSTEREVPKENKRPVESSLVMPCAGSNREVDWQALRAEAIGSRIGNGDRYEECPS